jgi:hypothetical protein
MPRKHTTALLVVSLLALTAAPASANVGETVIKRCLDGESLSGFSQSAYSQALNELSAGAEEYSDCSSLIHQAQLAATRGSGGSSGGSGGGGASSVAVAASPAEQKAVTRAAHGAPQSVRLGDETIAPGVVRTNISSALSSLPTPLLATLAFLLACLLLACGHVLRNRVRARRSA